MGGFIAARSGRPGRPFEPHGAPGLWPAPDVRALEASRSCPRSCRAELSPPVRRTQASVRSVPRFPVKHELRGHGRISPEGVPYWHASRGFPSVYADQIRSLESERSSVLPRLTLVPATKSSARVRLRTSDLTTPLALSLVLCCSSCSPGRGGAELDPAYSGATLGVSWVEACAAPRAECYVNEEVVPCSRLLSEQGRSSRWPPGCEGESDRVDGWRVCDESQTALVVGLRWVYPDETDSWTYLGACCPRSLGAEILGQGVALFYSDQGTSTCGESLAVESPCSDCQTAVVRVRGEEANSPAPYLVREDRWAYRHQVTPSE